MGRWLRDLVGAHFWPDPLSAALFDVAVLLLLILGRPAHCPLTPLAAS